MKINTESGNESEPTPVPNLELTRVNYFMTSLNGPGLGTREAPSLVEIGFVIDQSFDDGSTSRSFRRMVVCSSSYTMPVSSERRGDQYIGDLLREVEDVLVEGDKINRPFVMLNDVELEDHPIAKKNGLVIGADDESITCPAVYTTATALPDAIFKHLWQDHGVVGLNEDKTQVRLYGRVVLVGWCPDRVFTELRNEVGRPIKPGVNTTVPILDFHDDPKNPNPVPSLTVDVRTLVECDRVTKLSISSVLSADTARTILGPSLDDMPPNGISIAKAIADLPIDL